MQFAISRIAKGESLNNHHSGLKANIRRYLRHPSSFLNTSWGQMGRQFRYAKKQTGRASKFPTKGGTREGGARAGTHRSWEGAAGVLKQTTLKMLLNRSAEPSQPVPTGWGL